MDRGRPQLQRLTPLTPLTPLTALPGRPCSNCRPTSTGVDQGIYVSNTSDGLRLTCPACHRPTAPITAGAVLAGLLAEHHGHTCTTGAAP